MTHVSRKEWGARAPRGKYELDTDEVEGVALHWPGMSSIVHGIPAVSRLLRNIQTDHMDNPDKRWSDIAYQLAVDQSGNTYQLRGMRYRSAANGDTEPNRKYGAVLLVLAIGEPPTRAMIETVNRKLRTYRARYPHCDTVVGHKDVRPEPTACPGPIVSKLIHDGVIRT